MAFETWGTFSVADHLADRAFVADVVLYDRLVIPVPDDQERERWERIGRAPDVLDRKLTILEEPSRGKPRDSLVQRLDWSESYRSYLDNTYREQRAAARRAGANRAMSDAIDRGIVAYDVRAGEPETPEIVPAYVSCSSSRTTRRSTTTASSPKPWIWSRTRTSATRAPPSTSGGESCMRARAQAGPIRVREDARPLPGADGQDEGQDENPQRGHVRRSDRRFRWCDRGRTARYRGLGARACQVRCRERLACPGGSAGCPCGGDVPRRAQALRLGHVRPPRAVARRRSGSGRGAPGCPVIRGAAGR